MTYEPTREHGESRPPAHLGLDAAGLAAAIAYHRAHESAWRRDFLTESGRYIGVADEPEAPDDVLGPVRPRGGPNGLIVRRGYVAAEWGDTRRADMTFSAAKSYLAALAGLAGGRGPVPAPHDPPGPRGAPRPPPRPPKASPPRPAAPGGGAGPARAPPPPGAPPPPRGAGERGE